MKPLALIKQLRRTSYKLKIYYISTENLECVPLTFARFFFLRKSHIFDLLTSKSKGPSHPQQKISYKT
jgi:hypothetical protein